MRSLAAVAIAWAGLGCGNVVVTADGAAADGPATPDSAGTDAAGGPDGGCGYACWSPGAGGGTLVGTTACQVPTNQCQPAFAFVERIDVCRCSAGQPSLFVVPSGTAYDVAFFGPPPNFGGPYAITINGGPCFGGAQPCPVAMINCPVTDQIYAWLGLPIQPAIANQVTVFEDSGVGCVMSMARYDFTVVP